MTTKLIEEIRKLPSGTMQRRLQGQAEKLKRKEIEPDAVLSVLNVSDHAAGLYAKVKSWDLLPPNEQALPVFGHTTTIARAGGLGYDPDSGIEILPSSGAAQNKPKK